MTEAMELINVRRLSIIRLDEMTQVINATNHAERSAVSL